jgi:hypothetical protein
MIGRGRRHAQASRMKRSPNRSDRPNLSLQNILRTHVNAGASVGEVCRLHHVLYKAFPSCPFPLVLTFSPASPDPTIFHSHFHLLSWMAYQPLQKARKSLKGMIEVRCDLAFFLPAPSRLALPLACCSVVRVVDAVSTFSCRLSEPGYKGIELISRIGVERKDWDSTGVRHCTLIDAFREL